MNSTVTAAALALLIAGCGRQATTTATGQTTERAHASATVRDGCLLGTKIGPDGNVAETKDVFVGPEPIFLTLASAQAKPGLQITADILDWRGEEVKSLFKSMDNEKVATLPLRNLTAGRYTAKGTWGRHDNLRGRLRDSLKRCKPSGTRRL